VVSHERLRTLSISAYRYLGLTQALDTQTYLNKRLQTLAAVYTRNKHHARLLLLPVSPAPQHCGTLGLGRINYLLGVPPCDLPWRTNTAHPARIVRSILHIPDETPNALVDAPKSASYPAGIHQA